MAPISSSAAAASIAPTPIQEAGVKKKKTKRCDRKGFKQDRYEAYQSRFHKGDYKTSQAKKEAANAARNKERIVFDDAERMTFLTTMHKKKNERRVAAFLDSKKKIARENTRFRREQREAARQAYNKFAQVPILPNYKFKIPEVNPEDLIEGDEEEEEEVDDEDAESSYDDEGELKPKKKIMRKKAKVEKKKRLSSSDKVEYGGGGAVDASTVTVTVVPLFNNAPAPVIPVGAPPKKGVKGVSMDVMASLSDLPISVAQELMKLRAERKGPSHTKAKVKTLKELEKIRKIKKHSRKGHGKSAKGGKKKNRKS